METRAITVRGIVQGVGFRPFVYRLALENRLQGRVRNRAGEVDIEIEGEPAAVDRFLAELARRSPPTAQVAEVLTRAIAPGGWRGFRIQPSEADDLSAEVAQPVFVSPDLATCEECLAELFDPADRRFGYPFINCTRCGPRLSIITAAPYDRPNTTMAGFQMCASCRAEYKNPADRRFHAQPIACPTCGPRVSLHEPRGGYIETIDPLGLFVQRLRAGEIGALKGLGGFHLVCDAESDRAVAMLRQRKHREEKPLAVMVRDVEAARNLCEIDEAELGLLTSARRPIVLLRRLGVAAKTRISESVAPGNSTLGVMLPYTPLHHLLLASVDSPLVMTSGNCSDEPIAVDNDDALTRLGDIADVLLLHDRPIHVRSDDSVTSAIAGRELPVRRSRGYAPQAIRLPFAGALPILAVGGQLKSTFTLSGGREAFVSHHLGDLDHYEAFCAFQRDLRLYEELLRIHPRVIAHDLHPDYVSTRYALERAAREDCQLVAVQHHHAHLAACLAEHQLAGPVIGVIFDGAGYGPDGTVWGGEFLVGDCRRFERVAHLRNVGLPGGEKAIREPWRMALAHLLDADCDDALLARISATQRRTIRQMLERGVNSPRTSSAGRLFDAVASLTGLCDRASYEGQGAMTLESCASQSDRQGPYPLDSQLPSNAQDEPWEIDTRPLIRAVACDVNNGVEASVVARRFHATMTEIIVRTCGMLRERTGLSQVVMSGGVFLNRLLTQETDYQLRAAGFEVFRHHQVPPGDGGLSLGQLAVAAAQLNAE